jgi:class 3 adenylate cyclase
MRIGGHYGIDQKTILVRKLGLKAVDGRSDRQNDVWAGKPINLAAKLASRSTGETIWASDCFYKNLTGEPSFVIGQTKRPFSSRLANRQKP